MVKKTIRAVILTAFLIEGIVPWMIQKALTVNAFYFGIRIEDNL